MLPTFIVIGAMKAGTTALHRYLRAHPEVFMAEPKELDFFVERGNWRRGRLWYESHFVEAGDAAARGEASPNYTKVHNMPEAAGRIAALIPDARLVYLVRHPVDRMRSMYLHQVADGRERRPIAEALTHNRDYLRTSMYGMQLAPYRKEFAAEQILVMKSEDLRDDRAAALARVYEFVGADPGFLPAEESPNRAAERLVPNALGARLLRLGAYDRWLGRSWRAREAHRRWLARPHDPAAGDIPHGLEARFLAELAPDLERLRRFVGPEFDCWGLL